MYGNRGKSQRGNYSLQATVRVVIFCMTACTVSKSCEIDLLQKVVLQVLGIGVLGRTVVLYCSFEGALSHSSDFHTYYNTTVGGLSFRFTASACMYR